MVSVAQDGDWKITAYLAKKQDNVSKEDADVKSLVDYLKYFNEESAEAGISLGRMNSDETRDQLYNVLSPRGKLWFFRIRCVPLKFLVIAHWNDDGPYALQASKLSFPEIPGFRLAVGKARMTPRRFLPAGIQQAARINKHIRST